ncbi:MAG: hypothetical protein ACN4GM_09490 [Gammaproteobacteria bacterium]
MQIYSHRLIFFVLLLVLLQGCFATRQSFTRDSLNNEGLVVAEVIQLNSYGNVRAISGKPVFNSGSFHQGVKAGHMVVSLPPGKHSLQSIGTALGNLTTTYTFNLEFEIRAGSVTNLGKLIMLNEDKPISTRYKIISVENNKYMLNYLRATYPEAFGSIGNKVIKPKFKQLSARNMDAFQKEIARRKMIQGQNTIRLDNRNYLVYGGLGTLVRFTMSKDLKKFAKIQALKTNTLDPLLSCDVHKNTVACLTKSEVRSEVLFVMGNKVSTRQLDDNSYSKLLFESNGGLVLVNNQFVLMRSNDYARSWKLDKRFFWDQETSNAVNMTQGINGIFLYMKKQDAPVIKYNSKTRRFSKLDIPFDSDYLTNILETRNGIYIGPEYTLMSNARIYHQKNAKSSWQELEIPYSSCSSLKSLDKLKGMHLQLSCSSAPKLESKDAGKSWRPAS